jgi:hypothetical protein
MKKLALLLFGFLPFVGMTQDSDFDVCVGSIENTTCAHQYVFEFDSDSSGVHFSEFWNEDELIIYATVRMTDGSPIYQPYGLMRNFSCQISDGNGLQAGGTFSFGGPTDFEYHCWRGIPLSNVHLQQLLFADTFFVTLNVLFDNLDSLELGFMISDPQVYKIPNPLLITSVSDQDELTFNVYPNPASTGYVTISASTSISTVDIIDMTGRAVKAIQTNTQVSVDDLPAGIYFVRADETPATKATKPKRLVIQ